MSRRTILILAALVIVAGLGLLILPGALRCYAYWKILRLKGATASLQAIPVEVKLPLHPSAEPISLGYAEVRIPNGDISKIACSEESTVIRIETGNCSFGLWTVLDRRKLTGLSGIALPDTPTGRILREMRENPFEHDLRVARTRPTSYADIFWMTQDDFMLVAEKAFNRFNQNGIELFTTESVRGLIRLGLLENPGHMIAEVNSTTDELSLCIHCLSASPETGRRELRQMLSSFRFLIKEVPLDQEHMRTLILESLRKHPRFVEKIDDGKFQVK